MAEANPCSNRKSRRWVSILMVGALLCGIGWLLVQSRREGPTVPKGHGDPGAARETRVDSNVGLHPAVLGALPEVRPARRRVQTIIKYGSAEGEVGLARGTGETPVGPESFSLGPDGTILVADRVNSRVSVWSADGKYARSIALEGINLNDVMAHERGHFFVYDQVRKLLRQYDETGAMVTELPLNPGSIETRGYFHLEGDALYFADAAARDVLVATLKEGVLAAPDGSRPLRAEGVHGASGRVYSVEISRNEGLHVQTVGSAQAVEERRIDLALPGILAARFAGEDGTGRFYVQVERLVAGAVKLEVLTFSPGGGLQQTTAVPENGYAIWTSKLVEAGRNGVIVQFLPGEEQAKLNLFLE